MSKSVIFYFTNFKRFNKLCHEILTELKAWYTHIKRIWVVRNYGVNIFTDEYPSGYGCIDFDAKQHIKIEKPKTSVEENLSVCKSILQLCLFNIFSFKETKLNSSALSLNKIAYRMCIESENKKSIFNLYVPKDLRRYQPE